MQLVNARIDYTKQYQLPHVLLFTGNPVIKRDGSIVMGRGAARQVRDTYPGIDKVFGQLIRNNPNKPVLFATIGEQKYMGWFQVKHHWAEDAVLELIDASCQALTKKAQDWPDVQFHLNYPGIGNGNLTVNQVEQVIQQLPDNVYVYK